MSQSGKHYCFILLYYEQIVYAALRILASLSLRVSCTNMPKECHKLCKNHCIEITQCIKIYRNTIKRKAKGERKEGEGKERKERSVCVNTVAYTSGAVSAHMCGSANACDVCGNAHASVATNACQDACVSWVASTRVARSNACMGGAANTHDDACVSGAANAHGDARVSWAANACNACSNMWMGL